MKKYFISHNSLTRKAIKKISKLGGHPLVVVKNKNILEGILSSADLRKAVMNKKILNKSIAEIYNKKPKYIFADKIKTNFFGTYREIKKFSILPVVDKKTHKIIDILNLNKEIIKDLNEIQKIYPNPCP